MASKPTIALARWADTISAILTTIPSGLRDTGFVGGTIIDEGTVNYEINQLYQWALWLSDGDCAFHNLSATGTLGVTGTTTLTGALVCNGSLNANAGVVLGPFDDFDIDGSTGTVSVHSQLFMAGSATYAGTARLQTILGSLSTGNSNDYALPTQPAFAINSASGSPVITGMVPVGTGHVITFTNNTNTSVQFTHQDTNSAAANRFKLPGAATLTVAQDNVVTFIYGSGGHWLVLSKNF